MTEKIQIIDYGLGNLGSIRNMLHHIGVESQITSDPDAVARAGKLILPGVGCFDHGMEALRKNGLADAIRTASERGAVLLGICLGMQLLTLRSEEGRLPGLGLVNAETLRFPDAPGLKIPQMGWNYIERKDGESFGRTLPEDARFYFVHSYYVKCFNEEDVLFRTEYGVEFTSAFHHGNLYGVQFHPEKSHRYGMALLKEFSEL